MPTRCHRPLVPGCLLHALMVSAMRWMFSGIGARLLLLVGAMLVSAVVVEGIFVCAVLVGVSSA